MRVDLWDHEGGTAFAEYGHFRLGSEKTAFKLHVGNYSGNAGTVGSSDSDFLGFLIIFFAFYKHLDSVFALLVDSSYFCIL